MSNTDRPIRRDIQVDGYPEDHSPEEVLEGEGNLDDLLPKNDQKKDGK